MGRRVAKVVGGTAAYYLNSGDDEIAEYASDGLTLTRRFVPGPGVDQPIAMVTAAGVKTFFHQDKLGSVIAMTGTDGALSEGPFTYDVYGNSPAASQVPYRYTGRRYDAETGLYYYRARYYSPAIGRFLQTDPIGYKDGINWYVYVGNDPTDRVDPSGKDFIELFKPLDAAPRYADHTASLIGNDHDGWTYQSKDGAVGGAISGQSVYTTAGPFPDKSSALQAASNLGYKQAFSHDAKPAQDSAGRAAFDKEAKSNYSIATANCGGATAAGAQAGGLQYSNAVNPQDQREWLEGKGGQAAGWKQETLPSSNGAAVKLTPQKTDPPKRCYTTSSGTQMCN